MEYIFSALIGYLLGSFPTAYVLLKKLKNIDITGNGTGNVGAMNSFKVTRSKRIGVAVLLIDLIKGAAAVFVSKLIFGELFLPAMISLIAAVIAHCYSPWIKFKGGRGLATSAGGSLLLSLPVLGVWILMWGAAFIFRRNTHFANFSATLLTLALSISSANFLNGYSTPPADSNLTFTITVSLMMFIILIKHIDPIKNYLKKKNVKSSDE